MALLCSHLSIGLMTSPPLPTFTTPLPCPLVFLYPHRYQTQTTTDAAGQPQLQASLLFRNPNAAAKAVQQSNLVSRDMQAVSVAVPALPRLLLAGWVGGAGMQQRTRRFCRGSAGGTGRTDHQCLVCACVGSLDRTSDVLA